MLPVASSPAPTSTMTGASGAVRRISTRASRPVTSGRLRSSRTQSATRSERFLLASATDSARLTSNSPSELSASCSVMSSASPGLSSTTSSRSASVMRRPGCWGPRRRGARATATLLPGSSCVAGVVVDREVEDGPALGARLDPDAPAVAVDDLAGDGQADAGARVRVARVQALEHLEDALAVARVDADAVVGDREVPRVGLAARGDLHQRSRLAAELQRVGDQVLEQLRELHPVALDGGQDAVDDLALAVGALLAQALEHLG